MKIKLYTIFVFQIRMELISIRAIHWITVSFQLYCVMYVTKFTSRYVLTFKVFSYIVLGILGVKEITEPYLL